MARNSIAKSRAALTQFKITRMLSVKNGNVDYDDPFYRVRPRGFGTVLFEVHKPEHCFVDDFERFMDAIVYLSEHC